MKILIKTLIIVLITVARTQGDCNVCFASNKEACHTETEYSLCINGKPNGSLIKCPKDYVCTSGSFVCYPRKEAKPSCQRTNLCGVCSEDKVFSCLNETTIAFCYGNDRPVKGAEYSYCPSDTVCNINSEDGFCTKRQAGQASCITSAVDTTEMPNTSIQYSSVATEPNFSTIGTTNESKQTTTTKSETTTEISSTETVTTTTDTTLAETTTTELTTSTAETTNKSVETTTMDIKTTREPVDSTTDSVATTIKELTTTTLKLPTTTSETTNEFTMPTTTKEETTTNTVVSPTPATVTEVSTTTELTTAQSSTTEHRPIMPQEPRSPNVICSDAASTGSYYGGDETCKTFILCYLSGSKLVGLKRSCGPGKYFGPGDVYCSETKPDVCI